MKTYDYKIKKLSYDFINKKIYHKNYMANKGIIKCEYTSIRQAL